MSGQPARSHRALLLILLLAGFGLRLYYGASGLHPRRFWDEGYALQNVRSILVERTLKPQISYYPSPLFNLPTAGLLAAADRVNEALGRDPALVIEEGKFGPEAYLLIRWLQAIYGLGALLLIYRIGRRLFSPEAGLIALAALAFAPWGIHSSGTFKPDAFLLFAVLLGFDLALSATRSLTHGRATAAGAGIALAASAKLTGALVSAALAIGLVWPRRASTESAGRRLVGLALAALSSLVFFFATNPYGRWYPQWVSGLKRDYAMRAGWEGATKLEIPLKTLRFVVDGMALGPIFGTVALVGLAVLSWKLLVASLRRQFGPGGEAHPERAMFVLLPWIFTLAYATQTSYFKPNNVLPVVAFAALAGGWLLERIARRVAKPRWAPAGWALLLAVCVPPGLHYVYTSLHPTCFDVARAGLVETLKPSSARVIYVEEGARGSALPWEGSPRFSGGPVAQVEVPSLLDLPARWVAGADASIFRRSRAETIEGSVHSALLAQERPLDRRTIEPELGRAVGPAVVLWKLEWQPRRPVREGELVACDPSATAGSTCRGVRSGGRVDPGSSTSVVLFVPAEALVDPLETPWLEIDGERWPLYDSESKNRSGRVFVSPRFGWSPEGVEVHLPFELSPSAEEGVAVNLHRWRSVAKTRRSRAPR